MGNYSTIGVSTSTTKATELSVSASAKTAYSELISSTSFAAERVIVKITSNLIASGLEITGLFDLATGPASSESVKIPNMLYSGTTSNDFAVVYDFPLAIPAGTRVAVRGGYGTSTTIAVSAQLIAPTLPSGCSPGTEIVTYGAVEAPGTGINSFHGTQIDPGTTAHTKGSWVELTASTTADHDWLTLAVGRSINDGADDYGRWLVDVGTGGAGSETVVASNIPFDQVCAGVFVAGGPIIYSPVGPFPISISAGTRLSVRAQSNLTTEVGFPSSTVLRKFDAILYGA